jgi:hypothetical protein
MDIDTLLTDADPASHACDTEAHSAEAERLYQQITTARAARRPARWSSLAGAASGRRFRHRPRWLVLAGMATVTVSAAIVAVATSSATPTVSIRTTAYAVVRHPDGTVTLSVGQVNDAARLRHALAAAGVPALVRTERLATRPGPSDRCNGDPHNAACYSPSGKPLPKGALSPGGESVASCPIPGEGRFVEPATIQRAVLADRRLDPRKLMDGSSWLPGGFPGTLSADYQRGDWRHAYGATVTIVPSAIPHGSALYLNIGHYDRAQRQPGGWEASLEVVKTPQLPACLQSFGP